MKIAGHGSGNPSIKDMNEYCRNRPSNRKLLEVRRFKGINATQQQQMHDWYATIIGRNNYDQDLRNYCYTAYKDGKYYSDCSSSICETARMAGITGTSDWNTASMHYGMDKVDVVIEDGIIQNPEVLCLGDALMFQGYDYNTPDRPLGIGHTEMVYELDESKGDDIVTKIQALNKLSYMDALRKGEQSDRVGALQSLLNIAFDLDENGSAIKVDKDYGNETEKLVKRFQETVGITVDGIAGPDTVANLIWYIFEKANF